MLTISRPIFRWPGTDLPREGVHREGAEQLVATGVMAGECKACWPRSSALPGRSLPESPPPNIFTADLQYADTSGLLSCRRTAWCRWSWLPGNRRSSGNRVLGSPWRCRTIAVHPDFDTSTFERLVTIPKL